MRRKKGRRRRRVLHPRALYRFMNTDTNATRTSTRISTWHLLCTIHTLMLGERDARRQRCSEIEIQSLHPCTHDSWRWQGADRETHNLVYEDYHHL